LLRRGGLSAYAIRSLSRTRPACRCTDRSSKDILGASAATAAVEATSLKVLLPADTVFPSAATASRRRQSFSGETFRRPRHE